MSHTQFEPTLITWPMLITKATDLLFSHNELIALWYGSSSEGHICIWRGEAWALPDEYKDLYIQKIVGIVPREIWEGDTINLEVNADDSTPRDLPKKHHDTSDCCDAEPKRVEDSYHIDEKIIRRKVEIRSNEYLIKTKDGKYYMETPSGVFANETITKLCILLFS